MKTQFCPICGLQAAKKELYPQNFKISQINHKIFSARRLPDGLHYRIVKCSQCGLVFSDPILNQNQISHLYNQSFFTYQDRVNDLAKTYGYYLKRLENYQVNKDKLLEIGCGNGFFLEEAKRQGYQSVCGVEPSADAIHQAPLSIRRQIKHAVFNQKIFAKNSFDVISFFQTFDHIGDPNQFLKDCYYCLKPGGLILAINHNVDSLQSKILKEHSPIIDIEHTYLYNLKTIRLIFQKNKFQVIKTGSTFNIYPVNYIFHLLSLPKGLMPKIGLKLKIKLGNLMLVGKKPYEIIR